MIRIQPHAALAFHCLEELPASQWLRVNYSGHFDRCAGPSISTSKQASTQETQSTGGASSPINSGANASSQSISTSGAPVYSTSKGNVNIDQSPQVTKEAFDAIEALVSQALQSTGTAATTAANTVQQQSGNVSDLVSAVLARDQATAANTASSGQTDTNSTVKWVVGIVAAGLVGIFALPKLFGSKS